MILSASMTLLDSKSVSLSGMFVAMVSPQRYSWPLFALLCGSGCLYRAALPGSFLM